MAEQDLRWIDVARLRVGLFVHLEMGWQDHPFPFNRFKLRSEDQIAVLRSLGLEKVRYSPAKSDVAPLPPPPLQAEVPVPAPAPLPPPPPAPPWVDELARQQAQLEACETRFLEVSKNVKQLQQRVRADPEGARESARALVSGMADEVDGDHEVTIRLLSERVTEETSSHAINVTVLSLLLGKACGLEGGTLRELGVGALMHDVGKLDLPSFLRWGGNQLNEMEQQSFRKHVEFGVEAALRMGLPPTAQRVIAEHHERADGSGYPHGLVGDAISPAGRVVSLVNHYENLCNPGNAVQGMTPHEALASIYARQRAQFDERALSLFVRMMGIYPPGSMVELNDGRLAMVVSATPGRPLRPRVVVLDQANRLEDALILDLNATKGIDIHKCLRPEQVPRDAFTFLSLRRRTSYYFEPTEAIGSPARAATA